MADRLHREGMNELNQGEFEDGLGKLAAAVKADPNNLTYRLDLARPQGGRSPATHLLRLTARARPAGRRRPKPTTAACW